MRAEATDGLTDERTDRPTDRSTDRPGQPTQVDDSYKKFLREFLTTAVLCLTHVSYS